MGLVCGVASTCVAAEAVRRTGQLRLTSELMMRGLTFNAARPTHPEYVRLPDRVKELLTMRQIQYPHPTNCVLNLSHGEVSKAEGYSPCLTPQGFC